ncbi:ATP-citrate synthase beta chain protein 1-like [Helianthus annuus]|uniref:ATP-citrate synthase beta chain protein 1-like n=1 Tax=Helianthus annuus TaxID=4232 RepID=UPI000B9012A5|nr:ATP-citrate synthase beta chain protein 1-like [Helianthus annuus]
MRLQIDFPVQNFDGLLVLEIVKRDLSNGFQGIAIGEDVFPSSTLSDRVLWFNKISQWQNSGCKLDLSLIKAFKKTATMSDRWALL